MRNPSQAACAAISLLVLVVVLCSCGTSRRYYNSSGTGEKVNVGYGSVMKDDLTYSVSSLKPAENDIVYSNMYDYLRGRVPGVSVSANNKIVIRGIGSINSSTDPLVLVDGVETDLDAVNPHDVYSVDVLKDGSSSIYGVRGANGVILVTTKSGRDAQVAKNAAKKQERAARRAERKNRSKKSK
ncbi:MAG: TonB-dependent receptor plug domain-containing protein [Bacteroidales bacterium]|nr:TonB-dependent receptor plug domain-containing protein [Bacteroidales bacterium]